MDWYWWIIIGVVGAVVTLNLHELAHCLIVWLAGGKVTGYKPWPHKLDGKFYFGRMQYQLAMDKMTRGFKLWFYIAPLLKACFMLALHLVLSFKVGLPFLAAVFWEGADIVNWVQGCIRLSQNDGAKFRRVLTSAS